jgi:hypothetical protein
MAEQIKDAGRLNSPSATQPTEDTEMRSAMRVIRGCGNWESIV